MDTYVEPVNAGMFVALIDHQARVGAALAVDPWTTEKPLEWFEDREELDVESRIIGYAIVAVLGRGRFVVAPAPDEPWRLWGPDDLPAYAAGESAAQWSTALPALWDLLES